MGQGSGVVVSCDVGKDETRIRVAVAVAVAVAAAAAPIQPLAWESPYVTGVDLKSKRKKKKKEHVFS